MAKSGPRNHGRTAKIIGAMVSRIYKGKRKQKKIDSIESEYKHNGGKKYYATYFGRDVSLTKSIVYPQTWFDNPKLLQFEDMQVPCPGDPDEYCKLQYGETYMELPPPEKRKPHHEFIYFSVEEPYTNYKGKYY